MKTVIIADCLPGFHHPPGQLDVCVPDAPPVEVPTLADYGLMALSVLVVAVALKVARWK